MSAPNRLHLLALLLLAAAATLFAHLGRGPDEPRHEAVMEDIRALQRLDAELHRDLLRVRLGALRHYDGLNASVDAMAGRLASLDRLLLADAGSDPGFLPPLAELREQLLAREALVERFKSEHGLLSNSANYFAYLSGELGIRVMVGDLALGGLLAPLLGRMIEFQRQPLEARSAQIGALLDAVAQLSEGAPPAVSDLVRHGRMILDLAPRMAQTEQGLRDRALERSIGDLRALYATAHSEEVERAGAFNRLLYLVAVVLVVYLGYLFWRLRQGAAALEAANRSLSAEVEVRRRAELELDEARELAEVTLHSIGDAVISVEAQGRVRYMNPMAHRLLGWPPEQARGRPLGEVLCLIRESTREPIPDPVAECMARQVPVCMDADLLLQGRDGRELAVQQSTAPIKDRHGAFLGVVMVLHDVTEARHLARQVEHQARFDALTGLVNRREFDLRLGLALDEARRENLTHALAYIDLDQFKLVNDSCGHVAGDELLRQVATLMQGAIRRHDVLGRLGGDEFGLLLLDCPLERAQVIAEGLLTRLRKFRFLWEGSAFEVAGSVGLVPIDATSEGAAKLLALADMACYAAKDLGRDRIHVHLAEDVELRRRQREVRWAADIHRALDEDRFQLYQQPIRALYDTKGEPRHLEVLLRMVGPDGEPVPPGSFIPAAERFNLIGAVDRWVIRRMFRACAAVTHAREGYLFSINLSGGTLRQGEDAVRFIRSELKDSGADPRCFCFEITETSAIGNLKAASGFIEELKKEGFRFALDDFGSGLSSFAYLKHLAVDFLKIDGAFVRDLADDPIDRAMVEAINQVGHTLGMQTIAEWAETTEVLEVLVDLGVDHAQGYAIGHPVPLALPRRLSGVA